MNQVDDENRDQSPEVPNGETSAKTDVVLEKSGQSLKFVLNTKDNSQRSILSRFFQIGAELAFFGGYWLLRPFVLCNDELSEPLAWLILIVLSLDVFAMFIALKAIRSQHRASAPVIQWSTRHTFGFLYPVMFGALRTVVFATLAAQPLSLLFGFDAKSESGMAWVMGVIALKEFVVVVMLCSNGPDLKDIPRRSTGFSLFVAQLVLILPAIFVILLLQELMNKPAIDWSWNIFLFIFVTGLFTFLWLIFVMPFRALSAYDAWLGGPASSRWMWATMSCTWLWILSGLIYNSESTGDQFLTALHQRPETHSFTYTQEARLQDKYRQELCKEKALKNLRLNTQHTGHFEDCVYQLPLLTDLDLSDNGLSFASLGRSPQLRRVDLSHNSIRRLSGVGFYSDGKVSPLLSLNLSHNHIRSVGSNLADYPQLEELDLSFNPLTSFEVPEGALLNLRLLHLNGTKLSKSQIDKLTLGLPHTNIEQ